MEPRTGAAAVDRMLRYPAPPAGYMCSDDSIAIGALDRLQAAGIAVPAQAAVFGFGNTLMSRSTTPLLSTVALDRRAMGRRAVEMLHTRLDRPDAPPSAVCLPVLLRPRQTTAVSAPEAGAPRE